MKMIRSASLKLSLIAAVAVLAACTSLFAGQGNMHAALSCLQQARAYLVHASPDKAGWRVTAINDLDKVISDVENGIASRQ